MGVVAVPAALQLAAASVSDKGDMTDESGSGSRSEQETREQKLVEEEIPTQTVAQEVEAAVTPAPAIAATSGETLAPVTKVIQDEYNYFKCPKSNTLELFFKFHPNQTSDAQESVKKSYRHKDGSQRKWVSYDSEKIWKPSS